MLNIRKFYFRSRCFHYGRTESETVLCRAVQGKAEPARRSFAWTPDWNEVECDDCKAVLAFVANRARVIVDDSPHLARAIEKLNRLSRVSGKT
jgi:hypothetical protein